MALVVNSNVSSLQAQNNLLNTQKEQATTFERLSTGLRINSAKDDAGGMYLAQAQTTDIKGLNMATRNAGDGISMAQTAEGALDQIQGNLQRINELAIQSANGTYNSDARNGLQKEVDQLTQEITRIAETTEFNGNKLLSADAKESILQISQQGAGSAGATLSAGMDGGLASAGSGSFTAANVDATFESQNAAQKVGEYAGLRALLADDEDPFALTAGTSAEITYVAATFASMSSGDADSTPTSEKIFDGLAQMGNGDSFTVDGMTFSRVASGSTDAQGQDLKIEYNGNETTVAGAYTNGAFTPGTTVTGGTNGNLADLFGATQNSLENTRAPAAQEFFGQAADVISTFAVPQLDEMAAHKSGDIQSLEIGETLEMNGWTFSRSNESAATADRGVNLTASYQGGTQIEMANVYGAYDGTNGIAGSYLAAADAFDFAGNPGANSPGTVAGALQNNTNITSEAGNLASIVNADLDATKTIDISTQANAQSAIDATRDAINTVSEVRADFGASMNRFEAVISNNQTYTENLTDSRSRIQDADFAQETANLAKQQVLQQAGISVLGQANASTQSVLGLL